MQLISIFYLSGCLSQDGLQSLNTVEPVEVSVGEDVIHHLHRLCQRHRTIAVET